MNKKGNIFLGVSMGIFLFIMGVLVLPFITEDVTSFRVALDCSNNAISSGTKLGCLFTDALVPYYIWFFTSLGLGLILSRN